jgi:putative lipoprotein
MMRRFQFGQWVAIALVLAVWGALSVRAQEERFGTVNGVVTMRERIALPDDAKVVVELLDLTRGGTPAQVIATQTMRTGGRQVPFAFSLNYDLLTIDETHTYNVSAKIYVEDKVRWFTAETIPVILNGNYSAEVRVIPIELSSYMEPPPTFAMVTGTVTIYEDTVLPDDALIEVKLVDVSRADAPALVLASQQFFANGRQVTFPFALSYDPAGLPQNGSYSVSARITVGGRLAWISDTRTPVITNDLMNVDITLVPVES